jgi:L-ascorbate metabolism protein UlaG (beta-lactamase superfamily)
MNIQSLQFLGHSAFLINGIHEGKSCTVAIDPWVKENPACPDNLRNPESIDLIVLTHGHFDHAGNAAELALKYKAKIVAVYELANLLIEDGVPSEQVMHAAKGGTVDVLGMKVSLTNAFHSSTYKAKSGTHYAGDACGVVVSDGTTTVYHAGDTCLCSDMTLIGELYQPTIAMLPICGRFTMDPRAAARAAKMLAAETLIPIHWGTFPELKGTPEEFKQWCEREHVEGQVVRLEPGASMTV